MELPCFSGLPFFLGSSMIGVLVMEVSGFDTPESGVAGLGDSKELSLSLRAAVVVDLGLLSMGEMPVGFIGILSRGLVFISEGLMVGLIFLSSVWIIEFRFGPGTGRGCGDPVTLRDCGGAEVLIRSDPRELLKLLDPNEFLEPLLADKLASELLVVKLGVSGGGVCGFCLLPDNGSISCCCHFPFLCTSVLHSVQYATSQLLQKNEAGFSQRSQRSSDMLSSKLIQEFF